MSFSRTHRAPIRGRIHHNDFRSSFSRNANESNNNHKSHEFARKPRERLCSNSNDEADGAPSLKRRKSSASIWDDSRRQYHQPNTISNAPSTSNSSFPVLSSPNVNVCTFPHYKCERPKLEDDDVVFMSRDEIERCSPSRKHGIDLIRETHLRYSYCTFLRDLGMRLELPQTTVGTAMVLCHRFFVRRSHACHDRFLIAAAALFLAAKSEETPRPLNTVLRASCETCYKQNFASLSYRLPVDWFEQYRERVIEAEQMILTTLDFELNVQHPYIPLTSVLNKLGLSQTALVNLAWNLVSEGSSQE